MLRYETCAIRGLERYVLSGSLEHMLEFIYLNYSMMALHYDAVSNNMGSYNEGAFALDPKSTKTQHDHEIESMIFPQTGKLPPEDWSRLRLLWVDKALSSDRFKSETFGEHDKRFEYFPIFKDSHGRVPRVGSEDGYFRSPGVHSGAFNNLQSMVHTDNLFTPGSYLIHLTLLSNIPRRLQWLVVLTWIAIPIVSANVGVPEWAFGILAILPSTYVLANPPMPPTVVNGTEEIVWKFARGWWDIPCSRSSESILAY